MDQTTVF